MQIGTDRLSGPQRRILSRAKDEVSIRELAELLSQLIDDEDITSGREQVHPDWLGIFEASRERLHEVIPSRHFDRLSSFFEKLGTFDSAVGEIDPTSAKFAFLLGAGASKPSPSNIPTVKELLPQLLERARRLDRDDVTKLADFCDRRKIDNIEDLLTAAQLATFSSRNPTILRLMNFLLHRGDVQEEEGQFYVEPWMLARSGPVVYQRQREAAADLSSVAFLQDTLQVLFGLLSSTMLPAKPNATHEAIAAYVKKHQGSSIVTTNYDCCMDLALGDVSKDLVYRIDFSNVSQSAPIADCTRLIKLHGSLNWFYCETCQEVQLIDIRSVVKGFLEDKSPYPVIGICKDCGGQRRGLLVPPLAMKFDLAPPLTPLMSDAKDAFEKADVIVVVGFSFAEADLYISRMISKAMQSSGSQKLIVVDPDFRVVERVRRKFTASIPSFDPMRIIRMTGDCSELMPKLLQGDYIRLQEGDAVEAAKVDGSPTVRRKRTGTESPRSS